MQHYTDRSYFKDYRFPNFLNYRELCVPTNNQGFQPNCVGYAVGGYLECRYWALTHIPKQSNANKLYSIGRSYKCDSPEGTRAEYCFEALIVQKYINGEVICFDCSKELCCDCLKSCIHENGVIVMSFDITDEWYEFRWFSDILKKKKNPTHLGKHCVLCCGYDKNGLLIQNSWGYDEWGNYGFATVPWEMIPEQFDYATYVKNISFNDSIKELFL